MNSNGGAAFYAADVAPFRSKGRFAIFANGWRIRPILVNHDFAMAFVAPYFVPLRHEPIL